MYCPYPTFFFTLTDLKNPDYFNFQDELRNAFDTGSLPDDIRKEINKILAADLIILQFPMYWMGLPAILKGWIDRCFAEHVVFDTDSQQWFDNGPFTDKKVVLSITTGGTSSFFSNGGLFGDMDVLLWPIHVSGLKLFFFYIFYRSASGETKQSSKH